MAESITCSTPARIGFLGNPSDGYFGACISLPVWNWQASVTVTPAEVTAFPEDEGLIRILEATLKIARRNLSVVGEYQIEVETNIPRQVGLAGSSAIETAFLRAILEAEGIDVPEPRQLAELILKVETEELGMVAGLQDRLPQAFEEPLHMDFAEELMTSRGYGAYVTVEASEFPPLWVAHALSGKDSGETHSDLAKRWEENDSSMTEVIAHLADGANQGRVALENSNYSELTALIDTNFDLRQVLFGNEALGDTLQAVKLARNLGSCAKQTGSGGAIFGIIPHSEFTTIAAPAFAEMGWTFHSEIQVVRE